MMGNQEQILARLIEQNGFRLTAARRAIIRAFVRSEGHITADELAVRVRKETPQVGRMTVYRTLDLLVALGAISAIYQGTGAAHYILMTDNSHHHLVCYRCHAVIEFEECSADDLSREMAERFNFQVSSHLLELHGLCADCQE